MKKENGISRRTLLQSIGAVAAAGTMASPPETLAAPQGATPHSGQTSKPPRTIALIGDRAHNSDAIRVSLDRLFKELGLPIDYTTNYYDLSASLLEPYQLFVCLRDNYTFPEGNGGANRGPQSGAANARRDPFATARFWITEEQGKAVQDFVAAGNGFYSLHNNAFVSRSSKNYREVQGGVGLNHPPLRPYKVRIVNKEHPVTRGVEDFMVTDEQHYLIYDKDPKNILLHSENVDGLTFWATMLDPIEGGPGASGPPRNLGTTTVSGWAHEYGKGRVVFTAMGHTIHAMWQPEHLKMQKNAVLWLLKMT
jgi:type 1 glutamine amidotransferase